MPELPEVETIRRGLEKHLLGFTIVFVTVHLPKMLFGETESIIGGKIEQIRRFGKGLVIDLDNSFSLTIHVKMTGQLIFEKKVYPPINIHISQEKTNSLPNKWTHVVFGLEKGEEKATLFYNDIRQFGWIKIVKTQEVEKQPFFASLGKEPLKDLTVEEFIKLCNTTRLIKYLLLDQAKLAGVGNIYANEALFLACIHPARASSSLSSEERKTLFVAIETVLQKGIDTGGASERDYVHVTGEKGNFQKHFQVYKREGKGCVICGVLIKKIRIGGRGTWYCIFCQK